MNSYRLVTMIMVMIKRWFLQFNWLLALKVGTIHKIKDPYVSKNLKREAAIMAKLNHPIIVFFHRVVSVGHFHCLPLDISPGGNLCR